MQDCNAQPISARWEPQLQLVDWVGRVGGAIEALARSRREERRERKNIGWRKYNTSPRRIAASNLSANPAGTVPVWFWSRALSSHGWEVHLYLVR